jgi:hypothetical protein
VIPDPLLSEDLVLLLFQIASAQNHRKAAKAGKAAKAVNLQLVQIRDSGSPIFLMAALDLQSSVIQVR